MSARPGSPLSVTQAVRVDLGPRHQEVEPGHEAWSHAERHGLADLCGAHVALTSPAKKGALQWHTGRPGLGDGARLLEDGVASRKGIRLVFSGLCPGVYTLTTVHHDVFARRSPGTLRIVVTDADGRERVAARDVTIGGSRDPKGPGVATFTFRSEGAPVTVDFLPVTARTAWLNGFELTRVEDEPEGGEAVVRLRHDGTSSAVEATRLVPRPPAGPRVIELPAMTSDLDIRADGRPLSIERVPAPSRVETLARVDVPPGTRVLAIAYRQLDASLPFEEVWYLEHPTIFGPAVVDVVLPPGAVVERHDGVDEDPDPERLRFTVGAGQGFDLFAAYRTPTVPDLYDRIVTPNFVVSLPQAYRPFQPMVLGLLENAFALYGAYSGQDVNEIQGIARYPYTFPPGRWRFGSVELGGGLSIKGFSTVNARLIPQIGLPTTAGENFMVAITLHELGNGWWGLWEPADPTNATPAWINNEGHSGFLRAQAELDLGYCADAQREHAAHLADFLACTDECGGEIPLVSLQARYGFAPFRAFYAAVQAGGFDLRGLSPVERASVVVAFFSEQVGEDLVPFFDELRVDVTPAVRADLADRFPPAVVPLVATLACRAPTLRATPETLVIPARGGTATASATEYVCAPGGFTARATCGVVSLDLEPTPNCGTVEVKVDPSTSGTGLVDELVLESEQVTNSPLTVPIEVRSVGDLDLLRNGGFEDEPIQETWSTIQFQPTSVLERTTDVARSGVASAGIGSPIENDARLVQAVVVQPNTDYVLGGFIRTEDVQGGSGATLTVELPGGGIARTADRHGTQDFQRVFVLFNSGGATAVQVQVRLGFFGGLSTGTAWFDDVTLEELDPEP